MSDSYSRDYYDNPLVRETPGSQRNRNRLRWILAHDPASGTRRLLEIGCGTGGFLRAAAPFFAIEGIDISAYAVETARRALAAPVRQADLQTETLPGESYEVVAAFNVLEHLVDPPAALRSIHTGLVPGGWLAGSVPNNFGLLGGTHTLLTNLFDRTHVSTFTPARWRALFEQAGFRQVRFAGELLAGHNRSAVLTVRGWRWLSFNLMFACQK